MSDSSSDIQNLSPIVVTKNIKKKFIEENENEDEKIKRPKKKIRLNVMLSDDEEERTNDELTNNKVLKPHEKKSSEKFPIEKIDKCNLSNF